MGRRDSFTAPDVNCADGMPWPRNLNTVETFFCVHGFDALMDCEVVTGNQEYIKIGNEATSKIATIVHQKR